MQEAEVIIKNKVGLHARPASLFVQTANSFKSTVRVIKDQQEVDAKSILSVLGLGASQGSVVKIIAEGEDEVQAIETIRRLVENNFGEEKVNA